MSKVIYVSSTSLGFDDGVTLYSEHERDCCERHWLSFSDLKLDDFDGLNFDLSGDSWFERVPGYGIRLLPLNGHQVAIPGYGQNGGFYSSNLAVVVEYPGAMKRVFDISECQTSEVCNE